MFCKNRKIIFIDVKVNCLSTTIEVHIEAQILNVY